MNENQVSGAARNIGGKIEDAAGSLTGDAQTTAKGKIDQVTGKAEALVGDAKDAAASMTDNMASSISGMAQRASSQAAEFGEKAVTQGTKAAKYAGQQISDEPVLAMLAAGALGILVGYLIGRAPRDQAIELGRFRASYRDR